MRHIICIGNGIAGITAARHIRKRSDARVTVISDESDHFFSRTALMYIYMGHLKYEHTKPYEDSFWTKNRITLLRARVVRIEPERKLLHLLDDRTLEYDELIVATGSSSNKFGWPGQDLKGVQGLYHLSDVDSMERYTDGISSAVVIGGGLIGIEMAEMLHSRGIPVSFLVRESYWMSHIFPAEEGKLIGRHVQSRGIDLRLGAELDRIEGDSAGRAKAVVAKDGETLPAQFVGLTVGVRPNIDVLQDSGIETNRGVLVDEYLRTNVASVYAIGDCAELRAPRPGRRPIEALWYTGRMMGQTVAQTICGEPTAYDPGIWFNSAKFFDLEYQVYGHAPAKLEPEHDTLYWEHPKGEAAIRINYRRADRTVTGFNLLGVRYRHEICHEWLRDERRLPFVLQNLGAANFDPEFYPQYENEIVALYNRRFPDEPIRLRRKRGLASLFGARREAQTIQRSA